MTFKIGPGEETWDDPLGKRKADSEADPEARKTTKKRKVDVQEVGTSSPRAVSICITVCLPRANFFMCLISIGLDDISQENSLGKKVGVRLGFVKVCRLFEDAPSLYPFPLVVYQNFVRFFFFFKLNVLPRPPCVK